MQKYYITTPIYYVNDKPHIGHAYTSIAADIIARFKSLDGYDVKFLTGTDEHGQKVQKSAEKNKIDPQQFVDKYAVIFEQMHKDLNCSNTDFIRTTETRHQKFVKQIWQKLEQRGYIYLDKYAGWYSVRDEAFYQESELIDGKAPTGAEVEWLEEESYFFKLSAFEKPLLKYIEEHPKFILPKSRENEVVSFVKSGLKDLSISRTSFSWGVPVPDAKSHIMYVWIDALFNYMSADPNNWPADVHIVGKDILRFHAVYWPALLLALDLPLPKQIFAHGWWTNEGEKISKSLGNVLDPYDLIDDSSLDYFRFYIMREFPFGNDGNYSADSFKNRINAELANNIGNLLQRTITIAIKKCNGAVPEAKNLDDSDTALLEQADCSLNQMRDHIDIFQLQNAIGVAVSLGNHCNEYINQKAPWAEKDQQILQNTMFVLLNSIYKIAVLLQPIIPDSAAKMLTVFGESSQVNFDNIAKNTPLKSGKALLKPEIIFARI